MGPQRTSRRALLTGAVAAGAGLALPRVGRADEPKAPPPIPRRDFGRTGEQVSLFGLGCFYVGAAPSDEAGAAIVRHALDRGCTYLDTAPSYVSGRSEQRVGIALKGRRDGVFLATKTLERTRDGAKRDLEGSLRRLRVDRVDLIQVHCVRTADDLDAVLSPGGPLPALLEAKEKGLVRFVGVTVHEDPEVARAAVERRAWDSVLMPLNPTDPHHLSFVSGALPAAVKSGTARVAMKVFAAGKLLRGPHALKAEDCLRFAYGLDVATAIVGCATTGEVDVAADAAATFTPLSPAARDALVARAAPFSGRPVEWYKRA
jgi:aryl-alcohol dehydrogenase-like predicted oxidoreductase